MAGRRLRRTRRVLARLAAGFLTLAVVTGAGGFLWLRTSLPDLSGELRVAGVDAAVEIVHDANGIPHIRAATAGDAYFGLGFVHARDRLFQMDSMRLLASGRLSEAVGPAALPVDRAMRTLGLRRLAEETHRRLPDSVRRVLDAYAAGVNAFLETRRGAPPPEYVLLQRGPEPWKPADSLVWGRLMALFLSWNWRTEALRAALSERLTPSQLADLWPSGGGRPTMELSGAVRESSAGFARLLDGIPDALVPAAGEASNAWVLSGRLTASGKPLLANDPHLGFSAPGRWYPARIEAPGIDVAGVTPPGVPLHVLGHNGRIAWGLTNGGADTSDLYLERLSASSLGHYDTPEGPRPFASRIETILVRGGDPVAHEVRETVHGPVVSDLEGRFGAAAPAGHVVALSATGLAADDLTPFGLMKLNRAGNWREFLDAVADVHAPHQNVFFADTDGNIGFVAAGRVPVRARGDGSVPVPGWDGDHGWSGFVPFDALPRAFNPPSGLLVNANQRSVPDDYPWFLAREWPEAYRAERIREALAAAGLQTVALSGRLQNDARSLAAEALVPALLKHAEPRTGREARAVDLLRKWDGNMTRDQAGPLVFTAWLAEANRGLYADELGEYFDRYWRLRPEVVRHMLERRRGWCDDVRTDDVEDCGDAVTRSLERALDDLEDRFGSDMSAWRWGEAHEAVFRHMLFGRIPVLRLLGDIRIESDGGAFTVNRGQNRISDGRAPYAGVHGAGYRAVHDLADLENSRFMIATGPSGNPLSRGYDSMTRDWRDGKYFAIAMSRARALEAAVGVFRLLPR